MSPIGRREQWMLVSIDHFPSLIPLRILAQEMVPPKGESLPTWVNPTKTMCYRRTYMPIPNTHVHVVFSYFLFSPSHPFSSLFRNLLGGCLDIIVHQLIAMTAPTGVRFGPHQHSSSQPSNSGSRVSDKFWPPRVPGTNLMHRHACRLNIHTQKTKYLFKL